MKLLLPLCVVLATCASFAESPISIQERMVVRVMSEKGYCQGYDSDTGAFVAVTHASHRCERSECTAKLWAIHKKTFNESLMKARHDIEMAISGEVNAFNRVGRFRADGVAQKSSEAGFSSETEQSRIGFETLAMCGEWVDGAYLVTTAVAWSEKREKAAASSLAGAMSAAMDWESELRAYLEAHTLETLPPYGSFTDSNGFVHFFGAYAVDLSSARSSLKMNMLMKKVETRALANLHLASDGTAVSSAGSSMALASSSDGETSLDKSLEGMVEKSATGTMKPFRLVLEKDVKCSATGGKMRLVVYAYEPRQTADNTSLQGQSGSAIPDTTEYSNPPPSRVKIWNPITNRYEEAR